MNHRSRFASVRRVVFEDAALTHATFTALKRDAIHARLLLCIRALTHKLLFSNLQPAQAATWCRKFYANPDRS